jgi:hypothetical protein
VGCDRFTSAVSAPKMGRGMFSAAAAAVVMPEKLRAPSLDGNRGDSGDRAVGELNVLNWSFICQKLSSSPLRPQPPALNQPSA